MSGKLCPLISENYDSAVCTISQSILYILGLRNEYIWVSLTDALIIFQVWSIVFGFGRKMQFSK